MKKYNLTIQQRDDFCVPSILQAILRARGNEFTQEEIYEQLTKTSRGVCVDNSNFLDFLRRNNFEYRYYPYNETPFNEPDELLREMDSYEGIFGIRDHTCLLTSFQDPLVISQDPSTGFLFKKRLDQLLKDMEKSFGFFGVLKYIA